MKITKSHLSNRFYDVSMSLGGLKINHNPLKVESKVANNVAVLSNNSFWLMKLLQCGEFIQLLEG